MSVRIKIKNSGSLSKYGYSLQESQSKRRASLKRAVVHYGYAPVMRKVNALYVFNKNRHKDLARILSNDKEWLHRTYSTRMGFARKSVRKSRKNRKIRRSVRKSNRKSRKNRKGKRSVRKSRKNRKGKRSVRKSNRKSRKRSRKNRSRK